jgi:choline-sulfatase
VIRRLLAILLLAACAREKPRYNVLLITLDTTRADHLGCYGAPLPTPAIDALAKSGVRFDQADAAAPLTLPSHATILSGVLPLHHGVRNNGAAPFPATRETLQTVFQRDGYTTAAFVSSFVLDHRFGLNRGFVTYDDAVQRDATSLIDSERRGGATADAAIAWLATHSGRPFFAWVHFYDAHAPYAPPAPYPQSYDGEIAYVDAQVARIMAKVDRTRTIVVIAGDHGEGLGEHGELHHGLLAYESTLRVPFIIAAPQLKAAVIKTPVSTADLAPTIATLAGSQLEGVDGKDISEALEKGLEPKAHEIYAETEYPVMFGWSGLRTLRNEQVKLVEGRTAELFRLPDETTNIAASERRAVALLTHHLSDLKSGEITSTAPVDAETKAKLASLGYVAPSGPLPDSQRADPRAMRDLFRKFEDATAAMSRDPREAKQLAEGLVVADPRNRVFRSTLANACRATGDMTRAIALYREAVALSPSDGDAWYDLASALEQTHAMKEAQAAADEAARLKPNDAEAQNLRGTILAETGGTSAAIEAFQRALAIDPRNARAFTNTGNALRDIGHNDDAAAAYKRAAQLDPRDPDPLNGLGVLLVQQGHSRESLAYFDQALALAPGFGEARLNRAVALVTLGENAKARSELQALLHTPQKAPAEELLRRLR